MRTVPRWLVLCLFGLLFGLFAAGAAGTASAAGPAGVAASAGHVTQVAQAGRIAHEQTTDATAPPGPKLDNQQQPAQPMSAEAKKKVWVGGIAVVLLAIVYYGRKLRAKRKKSS
ncbi:hypothetical protein F0L68_37865 [Solihabitans fulvus]|uniref:MYXO-CTERM domain-containing protein n=1 Tax=Solihabitans fulvus TaxID=1892852 RepID=A0A5B2WJW1_9PSEU|nr:hypothetical protein [Solihabitans fulvus]KAA2251194.1 hypothetical protein F0L68_37865 [Solihabitans fulvus]